MDDEAIDIVAYKRMQTMTGDVSIIVAMFGLSIFVRACVCASLSLSLSLSLWKLLPRTIYLVKGFPRPPSTILTKIGIGMIVWYKTVLPIRNYWRLRFCDDDVCCSLKTRVSLCFVFSFTIGVKN